MDAVRTQGRARYFLPDVGRFAETLISLSERQPDSRAALQLLLDFSVEYHDDRIGATAWDRFRALVLEWLTFAIHQEPSALGTEDYKHLADSFVQYFSLWSKQEGRGLACAWRQHVDSREHAPEITRQIAVSEIGKCGLGEWFPELAAAWSNHLACHPTDGPSA